MMKKAILLLALVTILSAKRCYNFGTVCITEEELMSMYGNHAKNLMGGLGGNPTLMGAGLHDEDLMSMYGNHAKMPMGMSRHGNHADMLFGAGAPSE